MMNKKRVERILFFLENCNIAGLRFLGRRSEMWGKILWAIVMIASMIGMIKIFILTYHRFFTDIVSIGINTDYLHWTNTFLGVSICLRRSSNWNGFSPKLIDKNPKYKKAIYDLIFFNPEDNMRLYLAVCKERNETCDADLEGMRNEFIPKTCSDFMMDVQFNDKKFGRCEELFKYQSTLMGRCFVANSIINYDSDVSKLPLKFDIENSNPVLSFRTKKDVFYEYKLYIHSPEDLPSNKGYEDGYRTSKRYLFNIIEIENDEDVKNSTKIEERQCRFPEEKLYPNDTFYYSFSTCIQNIQTEIELKTCNCTSYLSPKIYKDRYCGIYNYSCIMKANEILNNLVFDELCIKSCIQIEFQLVSDDEILSEPNLPTYYLQEIKIINTPTLRYTRSVAQSSLDLVVTIGGVAGLFFGASVINIVEIIYLFFIRKF